MDDPRLEAHPRAIQRLFRRAANPMVDFTQKPRNVVNTLVVNGGHVLLGAGDQLGLLGNGITTETSTGRRPPLGTLNVWRHILAALLLALVALAWKSHMTGTGTDLLPPLLGDAYTDMLSATELLPTLRSKALNLSESLFHRRIAIYNSTIPSTFCDDIYGNLTFFSNQYDLATGSTYNEIPQLALFVNTKASSYGRQSLKSLNDLSRRTQRYRALNNLHPSLNISQELVAILSHFTNNFIPNIDNLSLYSLLFRTSLLSTHNATNGIFHAIDAGKQALRHRYTHLIDERTKHRWSKTPYVVRPWWLYVSSDSSPKWDIPDTQDPKDVALEEEKAGLDTSFTMLVHLYTFLAEHRLQLDRYIAEAESYAAYIENIKIDLLALANQTHTPAPGIRNEKGGSKQHGDDNAKPHKPPRSWPENLDVDRHMDVVRDLLYRMQRLTWRYSSEGGGGGGRGGHGHGHGHGQGEGEGDGDGMCECGTGTGNGEEDRDKEKESG